ncbi:IclR family transcriptional regulator [Cryobacterium sp. CG_9.6]|uniref:IclR family transcriptional regulator n=1 Tax=Cryobacterium sp. CG_9.6 TaxID=2760710 RepID=UPI0024758A42|nr:IclR family transcriptional regulator [Cryobacterium sp. CG_9.6]MDH6235821.1 DNA-binding IclR family transcriptional regulator [Cryobacterium sp. CG_9.6]
MTTDTSTRAVDRALSLLEVICDGDGPTLAESARLVDLAPSTALRLLRTLQSSGFVRKDEAGQYRPGSRIIQLGAQALSSDSLVGLARSAMDHLVMQTGESAYLSVQGHGDTALYLAIVEGTHSVRHANWVGRTVPLHSSAAGQALTAPGADVSAVGYVVVERGVEADVTAIAVPVRAAERTVAALSLVIPSYRVVPADVTRFGELLVQAAATVSRALGTHPETSAVAPVTREEERHD